MMMNVMPNTQAGRILYGVCCSSFEWGSVAGDGGTPIGGGNLQYLDQLSFETTTLQHMLDRRMTIMRLQVRQERIQSTFYATINNTSNAGGPVNYYNNMLSYVKAANAKGITVVICPHNFNFFYNGDGAAQTALLGSANYPVAALADFWYQLGKVYRHNPLVWFDLTNEPMFDLPCSTVAGYWNTVIAKIRESGFAGKIVCESTGYAGAINWVGEGCGAAMATLKDPMNNLVWSVHNYGDTAGSGSPADHVNTTILKTRLATVVDDCRKYKFKLFLGETNYNEAGANATASFTDQMAYIDQNRDVIVGVTQWAQGNFIYPSGGSQTLSPNGSLWDSTGASTTRLGPWKPYLGIP